jgi:hypothetical protein
MPRCDDFEADLTDTGAGSGAHTHRITVPSQAANSDHTEALFTSLYNDKARPLLYQALS